MESPNNKRTLSLAIHPVRPVSEPSSSSFVSKKPRMRVFRYVEQHSFPISDSDSDDNPFSGEKTEEEWEKIIQKFDEEEEEEEEEALKKDDIESDHNKETCTSDNDEYSYVMENDYDGDYWYTQYFDDEDEEDCEQQDHHLDSQPPLKRTRSF